MNKWDRKTYESFLQEAFYMKFSFDNFLFTDNKIRHIVQIYSFEYLIFFFHISDNKYFHKNDIHQNMEQYETDTNNENKVFISIYFILKLSLPHIHQIQQIIIDDLHCQMIIFQG